MGLTLRRVGRTCSAAFRTLRPALIEKYANLQGLQRGDRFVSAKAMTLTIDRSLFFVNSPVIDMDDFFRESRSPPNTNC